MITAIRSINFTGSLGSNRIKAINTPQFNNCDSVSFSGNSAAKLSQESSELVQHFTQKLKLNKVYKFDTPNVEQFQLASFINKAKPDTRNLLVQYSDYSNDNITKYIMFTVNNAGEVFENGTRVKKPEDIAIYEQILPELISKASKELKIN